MVRGRLLFLVALLGVVTGCPSVEERAPQQPDPEPAGSPEELMEQLQPRDAAGGARYFGAAEAKVCPAVDVKASSGRKQKLRPAQRFRITVIVGWHPQSVNGRMALRHVADLQNRYENYGVGALSIAFSPAGSGQAVGAAQQLGVNLPMYFDENGSAIRRLGRAAGADLPEALPALFIVDGQGRIRFYRRGFRFTLQSAERGRQRWELVEAAAPGKSLDDILKRLIQE